MNYGKEQTYSNGVTGWRWELSGSNLVRSGLLVVEVEPDGCVSVLEEEVRTVERDGEDATIIHNRVAVDPGAWVGVPEALAQLLGRCRTDAAIARGWMAPVPPGGVWVHPNERAALLADAARLLAETNLTAAAADVVRYACGKDSLDALLRELRRYEQQDAQPTGTSGASDGAH